jgi:DHA1 family tetracycline resistance protein-like MFS transporter
MTNKVEPSNSRVLSRLTGPFSTLLLVNFAGSLGFSIVMPFLVFLVHQWGGNALIYGFVSAAYSAFQLIGAPVLGRWSDRYGRKRVLFLSQLGTVVSWMVVFAAFYFPTSAILNVDSALLGKFSLTLPLLLLFIARAVDGLTGGDVSVANAYVADITPEDERDKNFGKMAASSNLGYIIGPALAGILGGTILGYELPVLFAGAISLVATILILVRLPDSEPRAMGLDPQAANAHKVWGREHRACIQAPAPSKVSSLDLVRLPGISVLLAIYFLVILAFNFFYVSFPVQAATKMQWSVKHTGAFFSVLSLFMVVVQGPVLSRLSRVWSGARLVRVGSLILGFGFLTLFPAIGWMAFAGAILLAAGNGLMWAPVVALLSKIAGDHQGAVQGLAGSVGAVASLVGLILGGLLYSHLGGWLFVMSAGFVFVVVFLSRRLPPDQTETGPVPEDIVAPDAGTSR